MERIVDLFNRNSTLFEKWSIRSSEELLDNINRIFRENAEILRETLSKKDYRYLKEYWLRNIHSGPDSCPACIKVLITWKHSEAFTPKDSNYLDTVKAEFDRIKGQAKYFCKSHKKINETIKADLSSMFEEKFFDYAEIAYYEEERAREHPYMMDAPRAVVECFFSDGVVIESKGSFPDYYPYDHLYDMAQIEQLVDQINRNTGTLLK